LLRFALTFISGITKDVTEKEKEKAAEELKEVRARRQQSSSSSSNNNNNGHIYTRDSVVCVIV
jgi:hypothetical protein